MQYSNQERKSSHVLYVGDISQYTTWQEIKDLFKQAGQEFYDNIQVGGTRVNLERYPDGSSKGQGVIVFENKDQAFRAMNMFNNYEFNGRVLTVREEFDWDYVEKLDLENGGKYGKPKFINKPPRERSISHRDGLRSTQGNNGRQGRSASYNQPRIPTKIGKLQSKVREVRSRSRSASKRYEKSDSNVRKRPSTLMYNQKLVQKDIQSYTSPGHNYKNQSPRFGYRDPRNQIVNQNLNYRDRNNIREETSNAAVYVVNIPLRASENEIYYHFKEAGRVEKVKVFRHKDNTSKGCAIVQFQNPIDARNAISLYSNTTSNDAMIQAAIYGLTKKQKELLGQKIQVREDQMPDITGRQFDEPTSRFQRVQAPPQTLPYGIDQQRSAPRQQRNQYQQEFQNARTNRIYPPQYQIPEYDQPPHYDEFTQYPPQPRVAQESYPQRGYDQGQGGGQIMGYRQEGPYGNGPQPGYDVGYNGYRQQEQLYPPQAGGYNGVMKSMQPQLDTKYDAVRQFYKAQVYVQNFPEHYNERAMRSLMARAGQVCDVYLPQGRNGRHKGYAIVQYNNMEDAERAIKSNPLAASDQHTQQINKGVNSNNNQERHHTVVVDNLRTRLKNTTKDFQGILEVRKDALQKQQTRKEIYSNTNNQEEFRPLRNRHRNSEKQPLLQGGDIESGQQVVQGSHRPSFMQRLGQLNEIYFSMQNFSCEQQQQLIQQEQQDSYLTSRHEALQNIQRTILELGGIFQHLSVMVQEQGEMAIRIDDNVDMTLANVEGAQNQLLKYLNSINSNRWLMLKVFGVLIVFLIIFVIFVV